MKAYSDYKKIYSQFGRPQLLLDQELLDQNIESIINRSGSKSIRIATKSVRSLEVLKYLKEKLGSKFNGFMCYCPKEALWLAENGLDNILVAYPTTDSEAVKDVARLEDKSIYLMVDSPAHIDYLNQVVKEGSLKLCLDIDLSTYLPGLNFGVFRSPLRGEDEFKSLLSMISRSDVMEVRGLMGYEAQIAGVTDNQKGRTLMNFFIQALKKISLPKIKALRSQLVSVVSQSGCKIDFINGGGTGSMESTREEDCVTEIAVGSGFYSPLLFDSYRSFHHQPALFYAIPIVRKPTNGIYTCYSGGYVASGAVGVDKVPRPYLPKGATLHSNEMAGEVQTPVLYRGKENLNIGDPIFFRHAKAGELCERFNTIYWLKNDQIVDTCNTYRGDGKNFG